MTRLRPTRLLSLGSMLVDIRIDVPHLPPRGGDVIGSSASLSAAGGFNILAAASRSGLPCGFAGRHGTGPYGSRIREALEIEGIAILEAPAAEGDSGFCLAMVEPDGERTFVTSPGVEARLGGRDLAGLALSPSDAVFVSGYDLCYAEIGPEIAALATSRDVILVVDPGPMIAAIPYEILAGVLARASILTLNRREATSIACAAEVESQGRAILSRLKPDALLVLRDGADGCFLFGKDMPEQGRHVPAPHVRALDTTGAGDTHTGVLVAALASGLDAIAAARRANAAAAISVTRRGPATAPTSKELDAFLRNRPRDMPPVLSEPAMINDREGKP
jgi:sugar/nucleoside kinase (ribokinase family)